MKLSQPFSYSGVLLALILGLTTKVRSAELNWSHWRGPHNDGHTADANLPTRWNADSIVWKTSLKGDGQSSPTQWGNRLFLTTALEKGRQRVVFCVNSDNGEILWEHLAWTGEPEESHIMNGWASATCTTDGEVVVAFFGKGGLHAYSLDGKQLWARDLGPFVGPWGTAACPVIVGNLVIQNGDSDRDAFIEAFDRRTGTTVWRKSRPDHRGWSTPIHVKHGGRDLLVLNGHTGVTAYDPSNGEQIWFTKNSAGRGEPTVTPNADMLYVLCGLRGDMYALRLKDGVSNPDVVWSTLRQNGRDLPCPIVANEFLFVSSMGGIASCYDTKSGKELWKERLDGKFSSSPIAIGGNILHQSEAGETFVIKLGPTMEIVARNKLPADSSEIFRASLTPAGGRIYSRSNKTLYCIGVAK